MLKSKLTAYGVTELAWMLEPKEHYGKVHRQYHSAPKTTTHCRCARQHTVFLERQMLSDAGSAQ